MWKWDHTSGGKFSVSVDISTYINWTAKFIAETCQGNTKKGTYKSEALKGVYWTWPLAEDWQ